MKPRLMQPLFSKQYGELYAKAGDEFLLSKLVTAYDCIWSQLYQPNDITAENVKLNAEANLQNLGAVIEAMLGEDVFSCSAAQTTFPEALLGTTTKPPIKGDNIGVLE